MSLTVCLAANTLAYPEGGGHLWVYLNWALGLRALGCRVVWLEAASPNIPLDALPGEAETLRDRLRPYGLAECVAVCSRTEPTRGRMDGCLDLDAAAEADLFLNLLYGMPDEIVRRFRRTALLDIDPGLLQIWMSQGTLAVAPHDRYFTIGETVGRPDARFPDAGVRWRYTPPCVALDWWPARPAVGGAAFTTVSHWMLAEEWMNWNGIYANDKRTGFLPFLDLPQRVPPPLELALCIGDDDEDWAVLRGKGWRVRHALGGVVHAVGLSALHPGFARRVQRGEAVVRPPEERLGERPDALLSGQRPAGRRSAHRAQSVSSRRRRVCFASAI